MVNVQSGTLQSLPRCLTRPVMPSSLCEQLGTLFIYTEACFQSADNSNSLDYEERRLHNAIIIFGRETQGQARAPALPFMWYMGALCPGQDL